MSRKFLKAVGAAALAASVGLAFATSAEAAKKVRLKVSVSFSVLGDIVGEVAGDHVDLTAIVGPDIDPHTYSPTPDDARGLAEADLIFINGLGFEGWIERLVTASGTTARIVTVSDGVAALEGDNLGHGILTDPHAWQDVANVRKYVADIGDALCVARPDGCANFTERALYYDRRLTLLDAEIRRRIAAIPADRRKVITSHDAFAYFSRAYGVTFMAPQGTSTEADASARDVAQLIQQIRAENVQVLFVENTSNPRLLEQIARETNAVVREPLYSDALSGPDGPAPTYIAMMRFNLDLLTRGMAGL